MSRILLGAAAAVAVLVTLVAVGVAGQDACPRFDEVLTTSKQSCPQTCRELVSGVRCKQLRSPQTICTCKPGYYKNIRGDCVTEEQCRRCSKPHEFPACDSACDNECATMGTQNRTMCPIVNVKCNDMCYCEDGYSRNAYGYCIRNEDCCKY